MIFLPARGSLPVFNPLPPLLVKTFFSRLSLVLFILLPVLVTAAEKKPAETAPAKVAGRWDFSVDTSAGSGNPTFTFKQDGATITGTYEGAFGSAPLSGSVNGKNIRFTFNVDADGSKALVEYEGRVDGKTMKGTVKIGSLGEGTFTATLAKAE
jgi:hypothetical protein